MDGDGNKQQKQQEKATYITLIGIFIGLFAIFTKREQKKHRQLQLTGLDVAMLGLASYRTGRLVAYDRVTQPLREPVTEMTPDAYGTSQTTAPVGAGVQKAIGELVACPTCTATWASAFLV